MVRCKLASALPRDTSPVRLAGGAFAVSKDDARDTLICDRRPQKSKESQVNRVFLPFCPRLRRLVLQRSPSPSPLRFFDVSMLQWRFVVGRTVRCKLAVALPSNTCPVQLCGGAFAVPKDDARDRLICDGRPQKSIIISEPCSSPLLSLVTWIDSGAFTSSGCTYN